MNKKKLITILLGVIFLIFVIYVNQTWLSLFTLFLIGFLFLNAIVYRKYSYISTHLFSTIGRNYEQLIISDDCNLSTIKKTSSIIFNSPTPRSQQAVEILVKRLYSLLDEDHGDLIIIMRQPNKINGINVFDIPYIHENTLKELNQSKMKYLARLPFIFSPIASFKMFFYKSSAFPLESDIPDAKLKEFLDSRNIKFKFFKVN